MSDAHTTATPETKNATPTAHPPVQENQRAIAAEVEPGAIAGQQVMRAIGGGSPETPPEQFSGALGQLSGRSQTGMLRQLQRSYGNSYVGRVIQAKLTVNQPGDSYEQEADRMAAQVMATPQSDRSIQREIDPKKEKEKIQMMPSLQRASDGNRETEGNLEGRLNSSKGGGSPLPDDVRSFMEPRFGADFSQVRVHTGSESVQMNQDLNAQAFTHRQDVYFGAWKAPGKDVLTAHELTHVVQQTGGQAQPIMLQPKERSWLDERIEWVRAATHIGNWDKADPPGAYYVLNGLSMDDMVRVLRALTQSDRKKLSDNLDEHATGFDRSRIQLALTNAAMPSGDKWWRDLSENIHWAIRSNKFVEYPDGAFWIINPLNEQDTTKIMSFLNRDHLDELIANGENAINADVPNAHRILRDATKTRGTRANTGKENSLSDLIPGTQKVGDYEVPTVKANCQEAFKVLGTLNDIDLARAIRSLSSGKLFTLEINIDQVDTLGIDGNRIRHFLQLTDRTANALRASTIIDGTWQPDYKKPPGDYSHTLMVSPPWKNVNASFDLVIDEIGDEEISPDEVNENWKQGKIGRGGMLWPSKLNKSTVPNLWDMKQKVRQQIANWHGQDILFIIQSFLAVEFVLHLGVGITAPQMTTRPRGGTSKPSNRGSATETSPGGCFVEGTKVLTVDGAKPIEALVIDDKVYALDPKAGERAVDRVSKTFIRTVPVVLDIRIGETAITCSPEHPFWIPGKGWQKARILKTGIPLLTAAGDIMYIDSVDRREGSFTVFNITVEGLNTYFVSDLGILVHNKPVRAKPEPNIKPSSQPGKFDAFDPVSGDRLGEAYINGAGEAEFLVEVSGRSTNLRGFEVFDSLYEALEAAVGAISKFRAVWFRVYPSNLKTFNEFLSKGMAEEAAAFETFTGKMLKQPTRGFTKARVDQSRSTKNNPSTPSDPTYKEVEIIFEK